MRIVRTGRSSTELDVTYHLPPGISLEVVSGVPVPESLPRRTPNVSSAWHVDGLRTALIGAGFSVSSDVELTSDAVSPATRALGDSIEVTVDVGADERSVILLEGEGGVFAWQQPDPPMVPRTRSVDPSKQTFTLTPRASKDATPQRRGPLADWAIDTLIKPIRVLVLKFFAQKTVDAIVSHIESDNPTGLVVLRDMDPAIWVPRGEGLPTHGKQGTLQVLLMVHGTFSSTSGSFGALSAHADGREFLSEAYKKYDAVIGFDHKTLVEDVETNAKALAAALDRLPNGTIVDSIAFSRGGLVWRVLAQELFARDRGDIIFRNTVFVGCTNAGTHLAEPDNWDDLIDFYTNVVMAGARAVGAITGSPLLSPLINLAIKTLGEFMQMLAQVAIEERRVPGLSSMEPDGETVLRLNKSPNTERVRTYRAITANFEPGQFKTGNGMSKALAAFLADRLTDRLFQGGQNDLVVDTASMTSFGQGVQVSGDSVSVYTDQDAIYHTVYFAQSRTCDRLSDWLSLPHGQARVRREAMIAPASTHYSVDSPVLADVAEALEDELPRRRGDVLPSEDRPLDQATVTWGAGVPREYQEQQNQEALTSCHVNASLPESPVFGEIADLDVILSLEEIVKEAGKTHVSDLVSFKRSASLKVRVRPRANCEVDGPDSEEISPPTKGAPQTLSFGLRGLAVGPAEVWVDILQGARRLTRLILQPVFVAAGTLAASTVIDSTQEDPPLVDLRIMEETISGGWRLRFIARCDELEINHEFLTQDFTIRKEDYVGSLYKNLESCWSVDQVAFEQLMFNVRAQGVQMFRALFPLELRRLIWSHRASIGSFQVVASEPSIPWEVIHVVDPDKPTPLSGGVFLAELGLVRWMSNVGIAPARIRLRRGKAGYCIPRYHDTKLNLASVAQEATMLGELLGAVSIGDEIAPVLSALARDKGEDFDALHFACHGSTDYTQVWNAGLLLNVAGSEKTAVLSVDSVQTFANLAVDGHRPLIFLNACQSGVTGKALSGTGGLAQAFVQRGAGLFVGTLWSIGDSPALGFASQFYGQLKAGRNVSHALRSAREQAKHDLDTSWLAYTVYGHPYARLSP